MTSTVPDPAEIDTLFDCESRWQSWLDVEAALAQSQAALGMIPHEAAEEIAKKARLEALDRTAMEAEMAHTKAPVLSLVHALAEACSGDAGGYVHWGGTTQNIILTGRVLQMRKMHQALQFQLAGCLDAMAKLADEGAYMVMAGRTNGQHALPITFGFKVAGWIEEFVRYEARFREAEARLFSLVFGGAIGAMQAFGPEGPALADKLGEKLGLNPVLAPTRAMVDHFVEYIMLLALFGTSCSKIARELYRLMSDEIGEVIEELGEGVRGSSTMPQKINPKLSIALIAQTSSLRAFVLPALEAAQPSHEGDAAENQTLYATIDAACPLAYRIAQNMEQLLSSITLLPERMARNLTLSGGMIAAENVMMKLAPTLGRQTAHDLVHNALKHAREQDINVPDALHSLEPVAAVLSYDALKDALDPRQYVGMSTTIAREAATLAIQISGKLRSRS